MAKAAEKDNDARTSDPPRPAMHKLKLLPEVTAFINRNGRDMENAIVDPETNLLQSAADWGKWSCSTRKARSSSWASSGRPNGYWQNGRARS